jgi:hypothetical protein
VIALFAVGPASADIVLRTQHPTEGESTDIFVQGDDGAPVSDAMVTVTYRPGSSVELTDTLGTTGASGRLNWTPVTAGIAAINATWGEESNTSVNVSVKFAGTPIGGVLIMIFAGLLLVGGSVVRIIRVMRSPD